MNDLFGDPHPDEIEHNGITYVRKDLAGQGVDGSGFDKFWANVPGDKELGKGKGFKLSKEATRRAFSKLKADDKHTAINAVGPFYSYWRKKAGQDTQKLHPVRFITDRRWEDEGWEPERTGRVNQMEGAANAILSGKYFLCTQITAATARTLIERKMVTLEQCREVRINI